MWTAKEIWEAGRAALAAKAAGAPEVVQPDTFSDKLQAGGSEPQAGNVPAVPAVFDPARFTFEARAYRVHFKNGFSGEYDGAALATQFPFDPREVESVEPVEELLG